ncbi:MAG TPA: CaiB/BaiF CoA-transferase family protein, partial [Solirubrobacteraceae bacterium]
GPKRDASGHDMNYLGLIGLLGLTGEGEEVGGRAGGAPIQSAGQIADLGGGALMAAFGIMAALRERDGGGRVGSRSPGSGEGQFVDISMTDGALSWLAMVAGQYLADGVVPRRGEQLLAGSVICYRPYECADGWVTLGALEPKFWQAWCRGVGHEELIGKQFEKPGSDAHAQAVEVFKGRTRADWTQFATEHDCCLEPLLELDEALASELVSEREMVVALEQPGVEGGVRQLGIPIKLGRTPGEHDRLPGPALGEHTEQVLRAAGYSDERIAELIAQGAVAGQPETAKQDSFLA